MHGITSSQGQTSTLQGQGHIEKEFKRNPFGKKFTQEVDGERWNETMEWKNGMEQ